MNTPDAWLSWTPVATRVMGVLGLVFVFVFWALTDRFEPMLLGASMSLLLGAEGLSTYRDFRDSRPRSSLPSGSDEQGDG